jgi:predicted metal-binding membrane protein
MKTPQLVNEQPGDRPSSLLRQTDRLLCMEVEHPAGWNARRIRQARGRAIGALAHQAHVSAAWLGEGFEDGQGPAASAAGSIRRRSRQPPVSGGTKAQHAAGAPAEVRVEHVGIVPIGSLHTGWALKIAGIMLPLASVAAATVSPLVQVADP